MVNDFCGVRDLVTLNTDVQNRFRSKETSLEVASFCHPDLVSVVGESWQSLFHLQDERGQRLPILLYLGLHGQDLPQQDRALSYVRLHILDVIRHLKKLN